MADDWNYRIESYRRVPGEAAWSPAPDGRADLWLLLGQRGEDHRCFGAFASRADAERGLEYARSRDRRPEQARGGVQRRDRGYYATQGRNGTEDEITIHAPDGRAMA